LITGGAGFIGSNLCEYLLGKDYEVVCLDNFATGKPENIQSLLSDKRFRLIVGDIRNIEDCRKACEGVDCVSHQAALGSVPRSVKDPITSNTVNVGGFLNMLVAACDVGVKRFVYAASSSTYGDSETLPKTEDKIGKPLSPYAVTKYVNELYADVFHRVYGLDSIGLRYFNVFGRRQYPSGAYAAVIPLFVKKFLDHKSPVINGDGEYSRDFTYIDNVLQANYLALTAKNPDSLNTVYNVACGERTTLNRLTALIREMLAEYEPDLAEIEILHGDYRQGDIPHSLASIDRAKNLLGYEPSHYFEQGLKEAVKWYKNNL
jgi:UDP-N-acetylglucosamine 4-epimerase